VNDDSQETEEDVDATEDVDDIWEPILNHRCLLPVVTVSLPADNDEGVDNERHEEQQDLDVGPMISDEHRRWEAAHFVHPAHVPFELSQLLHEVLDLFGRRFTRDSKDHF